MAIPSITLTLTPQLNALAVIAQSSHDLLVEAQKTKEIFQEQTGEKEKALQEQAARISLLEKQVQQLEAANKKHQVIEQALQGRVDQLICEKGELVNKIAYLERGLAALQNEWADHKKWREEYYDIIGGLRGWSGFSRDAALAKCRKHGF
jgi:polyhydroxyalkanoate synthesis regulator phasin